MLWTEDFIAPGSERSFEKRPPHVRLDLLVENWLISRRRGMRIVSIKDFAKDLRKLLFTTADGLATLVVIAIFLSKGLLTYWFGGGSLSEVIEGVLFSFVSLLMLIWLRMNSPVYEWTVNWGALISVVAFSVCILTLR